MALSIPSLDVVRAYKAGAFAARHVPRPISGAAVATGGAAASLLAGDRRTIVKRNLERVYGRPLTAAESKTQVAEAFAHYGRYYLDSFRLPSLRSDQIDAGFTHTGYHHITEPLERGVSPILVLPHLGGWEWAAFWLTKVQGHKVTAVVEQIEPPELFEWFRSFRESLGMKVVPVGPQAGTAVMDALANGEIVCLLADRLVGNASSVPVTFFGERTHLPAGAAALALRTGSPLIPVSVYFDGDSHYADTQPALDTERHGSFRKDVARVTQAMAHEFERFIRVAPEQWHVLQPGWPSDYRALGRRLPEVFEKISKEEPA